MAVWGDGDEPDGLTPVLRDERSVYEHAATEGRWIVGPCDPSLNLYRGVVRVVSCTDGVGEYNRQRVGISVSRVSDDHVELELTRSGGQFRGLRR